MDKSRDISARPEIQARLDAMVKAGWSVGRTWGFSLGSGVTDGPLGTVIADPTKILETAPGEPFTLSLPALSLLAFMHLHVWASSGSLGLSKRACDEESAGVCSLSQPATDAEGCAACAGVYNEEVFASLDWVLAEAADRNLRIILPIEVCSPPCVLPSPAFMMYVSAAANGLHVLMLFMSSKGAAQASAFGSFCKLQLCLELRFVEGAEY